MSDEIEQVVKRIDWAGMVAAMAQIGEQIRGVFDVLASCSWVKLPPFQAIEREWDPSRFYTRRIVLMLAANQARVNPLTRRLVRSQH